MVKMVPKQWIKKEQLMRLYRIGIGSRIFVVRFRYN
jgi:hypothetical protein